MKLSFVGGNTEHQDGKRQSEVVRKINSQGTDFIKVEPFF